MEKQCGRWRRSRSKRCRTLLAISAIQISALTDKSKKNKTRAHRSDILHDGELEFVAVFCEDFLEVFPFVERSNNTPDGVSFLQRDVDNVGGEETVCAGDEDLISWSDSRHDIRSLCGCEDVENGRAWRSFYMFPYVTFQRSTFNVSTVTYDSTGMS